MLMGGASLPGFKEHYPAVVKRFASPWVFTQRVILGAGRWQVTTSKRIKRLRPDAGYLVPPDPFN